MKKIRKIIMSELPIMLFLALALGLTYMAAKHYSGLMPQKDGCVYLGSVDGLKNVIAFDCNGKVELEHTGR